METLEARLAMAADPVISEFLADNNTTLADQDGGFSDWIEIHNPDVAPVDLTGWYLTDNAGQLGKWQFPATTIPAGGHLVVFASDKDRAVADGELHTNFKLDAGGEFLALVRPDASTVVSQYAPLYPRQIDDVSYGIGENVSSTPLLASGSTGKLLTPISGALGTSWTAAGFADAAWTAVDTAIGFETATVSTYPLPDNRHFYGPYGPGGTYNLYEVVTTAAGFTAANTAAQARLVQGVAGHLATIHSAGEAILVRDAQAAYGGEVWIGLTDREAFGGTEAGNTSASPLPPAGSVPGAGQRGRGFVWVTGEPFTYSNWGSGSPSDLGKDFVAVAGGGFWNDRRSSPEDAAGSTRAYVVEYELHLPSPPGNPSQGLGFRVTEVTGNGVLNTIGDAESSIESGDGNAIQYTSPFINRYDPQTNGTNHFASPQAFATNTAADDDDIALRATGVVKIATPGAYTFGVSSDDGFRLRIKNATFSGVSGANTIIAGDTMEHAGQRGPADSLGVVNLAAGAYEIELTMYERGGGAMVELYAASGAKTAFDSTFRLVGDTANGGLELSSFGHLIETDIAASMHTVNATSYLRLPFTAENPEDFDRLSLRVRYDDGFVAYLNGQEVARRNAPASLAWNSAATAAHANADAVNFESIDVSAYVGSLVDGANVLAIQALNTSAGDGDFLFDAELDAATLLGVGERYFSHPTPGAANDTSGVIGVVENVEYSREHGFYNTSFQVTLNTDTDDAEIRYTTDGSTPTATTGNVYQGPITVSTTTTLRAAAFVPGFQQSEVGTQTYLFLEDVIHQTGAGLPGAWGSVSADYEMDPNVVNDPDYSGTIKNDLLSLPTMSIVTDSNDLFGPGGIYVNPLGEGDAWERTASVELINPDGTKGFQQNAGLRMFGGYSRNPGATPKHSFRLLFQREHGPGKLNYPLFGDGVDGLEATDSFDTIVLRANFNDSWGAGNGGATYVVDEWSRRTQLAMNDRAGYGNFVHLYVNGLYWGLYNPTERHDADFMETYFGGDAADYDTLHTFEVRDGDRTAWNAMMGIAAAGLSSDAQYQAIKQYLDVENLVDYVIMNIYGGNWDWPHNNWDAARRREPGAGFQFFDWDGEGNLSNVGADNSDVNAGDSPGYLYSQLRANAEFRLLFADRLQKFFFNDGALTPTEAAARYQSLIDEIDRSMVGESARWGDARREPPFSQDGDFANMANSLLNNYFPQRTGIVLNQFRNDGLYPAVDAPIFSQHGGTFAPGYAVSMSLPGSQQYVDTTLLASTAAAKAFVPTNDTLGTSWTQPGFNNLANWTNGTLGVGYERQTGYESLLGTDVGNAMFTLQQSVYIRKTFDLASVPDYERLVLKMKYDDGFVAYLNGVEVARVNAPNPVAWNSGASQGHADGDAVVFQDFDITAFKHLLTTGTNVLAIQGLNAGAGSSDMLILPEIVGQTISTGEPTQPIWYTTDGSDPRLPGGAIRPSAIQYTGEVPLAASTVLRARTLTGGVWSALNEASFSVDLGDLRLTELMYHPAPPVAGSIYTEDDFEFVELMNTGSQTLDLSGAHFTNGIDFTFAAGTHVAPSARVVIVANASAFAERYGAGVVIAGQYSGLLDNAGERLRLAGSLGDELFDFRYDDDWRAITDGEGFSLTTLAEATNASELGNADHWRVSQYLHGSPGIGDVAVADGAVVINEVLAGATDAASRRIELRNTTSQAIDLGGWFLSDSAVDLRKYRFPVGTALPANGYLVLNEQNHFGVAGNPGVATPWGLSMVSGGVFLSSGDGAGQVGGYRHSVSFAGSELGVSFGRIVTSVGDERFAAMSATTFGAANAAPAVAPVVINEIMYHPADDGDDEFIELRNTTASAVTLSPIGDPTQAWQLLGAVQFTFPTGATIAANGYALVVAGDPDTFRAAHNVPASTPIYGPFTGKLDNGGERVALYKGGTVLPGPIVPVIEVDAVEYNDKLPWPLGADGQGQALGRISATAFGDDVANWQLSTTGGTPGRANVGFDSTPPSAAIMLAAAFTSASEATISWSPAVDAQSGVSLYQVFRGGAPIGATTSTTFVDTSVPAGITFGYQVRAINGDGIVGPTSASLALTAVGLESVRSLVENRVVVKFTESVTAASATNLANYTIGGVTVLAASLAADNRTVTLTITSVLEGPVYTLSLTNIVGTSGRTLRPLTQATFTLGESGFYVRMADVNGGADGQVNSTTEAINILNGNYGAGNYTFASDNTITAPYVNFGGPGSFTTPPILAYPNGLIGSGGDAEREQFALRATSVVTIPVGTWTIDFGSDDGGRVLLAGVNFASKYNDGDSAANEIRFEAPRGHGHTGGTFTVAGSPLTTTLELVMYEQGGGDSVDLSIASGAVGGFDGNFVMLQDGALGWSVKTQGTPVNQPPIVVDVVVRNTTWSTAFAGQFSGGAYTIADAAGQLAALPWSGINQVQIRFSEAVIVQSSHLQVRGVNVANYPIAGFSYDAANKTGIWTLGTPIGADKIRLVLDDAVTDTRGLALDGEWTTSTSTFSGNGTSGGDLSYRFNVLWGDADGVGGVSGADLTATRLRQFTFAGHAAYSPRYDLNADGVVNISDLVVARDRGDAALPAAEPAASPAAPDPPTAEAPAALIARVATPLVARRTRNTLASVRLIDDAIVDWNDAPEITATPPRATRLIKSGQPASHAAGRLAARRP